MLQSTDILTVVGRKSTCLNKYFWLSSFGIWIDSGEGGWEGGSLGSQELDVRA